MSLASLVGSPMQITAPGQIPERYRKGFEDFYNQNPNDYMHVGGQAISYVTTPQGETIQFGDTGGASNFRRYLESIGESPIANPNDGLLVSNMQPLPNFGLRPQPMPLMPDYSGQFEKFGEQLGGFGEQLTGYGDALGTFNEQVGGMGKQFETISNRLDSVDKGLGSLGNQIASLEQAQSQQVTQPQPMPQQPMYSPFGFGLGALFGRRFF